MKRVALVGSRKTPESVLEVMRYVGKGFSDMGIQGISGDAIGADQAWMEYYGDNKILLTVDKTGPNRIRWCDLSNESRIKSVIHARTLVSNFDEREDYVQKLLARDVQQILGLDCIEPVDAVFFWAPERNGRVKGGTRVAVHLARRLGIPTYNLLDTKIYDRLRERFVPKRFDIFELGA